MTDHGCKYGAPNDGDGVDTVALEFRLGRGAVGLLPLSIAAFVPQRLLRVLCAWFGVSHLVAAATGYRGCPELGAIPSLVTGRRLDVGSVPGAHSTGSYFALRVAATPTTARQALGNATFP